MLWLQAFDNCERTSFLVKEGEKGVIVASRSCVELSLLSYER